MPSCRHIWEWRPKSGPLIFSTKSQPSLVWKPKSNRWHEQETGLLDSHAVGKEGAALDSPPSLFQDQENPNFSSRPASPSQFSPPGKENPNPSFTAATSDIDLEGARVAMANFPVNPQPFLLADMQVDHGWNRPARGRLALGGEPTREHEDYAIVSIQPMAADADQNQLRQTLAFVALAFVVNFLEHNQRVRIESSHLSPLGLGLIRLRTVAQRDRLVHNSPFNLGQNHVVSVVNHDEGINARDVVYTRLVWIMFLAFPLDFQNDVYMRAAVAPYGRLLAWYTDENKSRILVRALILSPDRIPRSLVVSRGTLMGGQGRSWVVPVYILNGQFPDVFLGDEDPVPL